MLIWIKKAFNWIVGELFDELIFPFFKVLVLITAFVAVLTIGMLITAMLGIADYETMRSAILHFAITPW